MLRNPKVGERVRVMQNHRWMKSATGVIKEIQHRIGNNIIVKFDRDLLGMYHDEDGDAVLRLSETDLERN